MKIGSFRAGGGRSKPSPYSEGRTPSKAGHGHYHTEIKLSRDSRIDPSGNYRDKPRSLAGKADNVSGMGYSRAIPKAPVKRYGP